MENNPANLYFDLNTQPQIPFRYNPIKLKEIRVPPFVIGYTVTMETIQLYRLKEEFKKLTRK